MAVGRIRVGPGSNCRIAILRQEHRFLCPFELLLERLKDRLELKTISTCRKTIMGFHAIADSRCGPLLRVLPSGTRIVWSSSPRTSFDTQPISHYATKTQRAAACRSYSPGNGFNGLLVHILVHTRDLYVLLSRRHCAGVFTGLDSENTASENQRPTAQYGAVGFSFLGGVLPVRECPPKSVSSVPSQSSNSRSCQQRFQEP